MGVIRDLHRKMDEIIGRQERSLSVLTAIQNSGGAVAAGGAKAGGGVPVDTIRRDEVNAVLANQREMVTAARDIKYNSGYKKTMKLGEKTKQALPVWTFPKFLHFLFF